MSFSSIASDAKTELEVILDIADKFATIMDQPKLKSAISFAYGLTDEEKARTATAQAFIQKYTDIVATNDKQIKGMEIAEAKRKEDIATAASSLDASQKEIVAKQAILDATIKDIAAKQKALDDQSLVIKQSSDDLLVSRQNLDAAKRDLAMQFAKLSDDSDALAVKQKQVEDYEITLKSKALQLQKLTEGM